MTFADGKDMLSRNISNLLITSQKGERLDYATAEDWNLAENTANFQCEMEIVQFLYSTNAVVILTALLSYAL